MAILLASIASVTEWDKEDQLQTSDALNLVRDVVGTTNFESNSTVAAKIRLYKGDLTKLSLDAIVNAANNRLLGGGGVDGAIHAAAGNGLYMHCKRMPEVDGSRLKTGDAVLTPGFNLPAKHVIHTVGPIGENPDLLAASYRRSLELAVANGIRTLAFPCISTGVYGYPPDRAAAVALSTVRAFLESHAGNIDAVVFCVFLESDLKLYKSLIPVVFPVPSTEEVQVG